MNSRTAFLIPTRMIFLRSTKPFFCFVSLFHRLEYGGPCQKYGKYRAYTISSKFGKFPINIRVVVAREAYKVAWLLVPSAVVALPARAL
jgi:uncharacterized membrane protein YbaN (DUF454 family)